mmetsp:Transcript_116815/g.371811  ORF Transcript_116815/g.371811 Transcript_116815/m.371811 type:complete len:216 (+) Transcript_116815:89-736(+)
MALRSWDSRGETAPWQAEHWSNTAIASGKLLKVVKRGHGHGHRQAPERRAVRQLPGVAHLLHRRGCGAGRCRGRAGARGPEPAENWLLQQVSGALCRRRKGLVAREVWHLAHGRPGLVRAPEVEQNHAAARHASVHRHHAVPKLAREDQPPVRAGHHDVSLLRHLRPELGELVGGLVEHDSWATVVPEVEHRAVRRPPQRIVAQCRVVVEVCTEV